MTRRLTFLLSKDPATSHGGDMTMFRAIRDIVRDWAEVDAICLSDEPGMVSDDIVRVPKPAVSAGSLAARSLRHRRSLVHARYDVDGLAQAIDRSGSREFVAIHSYMAESYLRSAAATSGAALYVSAEISEASVWQDSGRPLSRIEVPRIRRDELRVAGAARSVGSYDPDDITAYRSGGVDRATWLQVTFAPRPLAGVDDSPPRLVFLGDRRWPPNDEAYRKAVALWPQIASGIPEAELWIIGHPAKSAPDLRLPAGVRDQGFVSDLDAVLDSSRGMLAPVATGGGVRVKLLDAASRGLPVVGTSAAVGSLSEQLGITAHDDEDAFIAACRELLTDAAAAALAGKVLHDANAARWDDRVPHDSIAEWLAA